jgi:hypothetical protein
MIKIDGVAGIRVTMSCGVNASPSELLGILVREIPMIGLV